MLINLFRAPQILSHDSQIGLNSKCVSFSRMILVISMIKKKLDKKNTNLPLCAYIGMQLSPVNLAWLIFLKPLRELAHNLYTKLK